MHGLRSFLLAGGDFQASGTIPLNYLARWDGDTWSELGGGTNASVRAFGVCGTSALAGLYAGGNFTTAGGTAAAHIARWDRRSWTGVGGGVSQGVTACRCWDEGPGETLFVGGQFSYVGGQSQWDGGILSPYIARWDGADWSAPGSLNYAVWAMLPFDAGLGLTLYAGGLFYFDAGGGVQYPRVAEWTGTNWTPLGHGVEYGPLGPAQVFALVTYDDGTGPALFVAGNFRDAQQTGGTAIQVNNIAKWQAGTWHAVGGGTTPNQFAPILAAVVFDDGSGDALYVGGSFTSAGGVAVNNVARWNGTAWSDVGGGVTSGSMTFVRALAVFDDGNGPALYAAGEFTHAGGTEAANIAKWNGTEWSAIEDGLNARVWALSTFPDLGAPNLSWDTTFDFDFSTLADQGANYMEFAHLEHPAIMYIGPTPPDPAKVLHLPANGSLKLGTLTVLLPAVTGDFTLDFASPWNIGTQIVFGFGASFDEEQAWWDARTGDIGGGSFGLKIVRPAAPIAQSPAAPKDRFISFVPANSASTALRVKTVAPPAFAGMTRWVATPFNVTEQAGSPGTTPPPTFKAARLPVQCQPAYADWSSVGLIHAFGDAILPGATYEVQAIAEGCDTSVQTCYSKPLTVTTGIWGDVAGAFVGGAWQAPNGVVEIIDITAALDKYANRPGAPSKTWCDLDPEPIDLRINITDVQRIQAAFQGLPYPFDGPDPCQ